MYLCASIFEKKNITEWVIAKCNWMKKNIDNCFQVLNILFHHICFTYTLKQSKMQSTIYNYLFDDITFKILEDYRYIYTIHWIVM